MRFSCRAPVATVAATIATLVLPTVSVAPLMRTVGDVDAASTPGEYVGLLARGNEVGASFPTAELAPAAQVEATGLPRQNAHHVPLMRRMQVRPHGQLLSSFIEEASMLAPGPLAAMSVQWPGGPRAMPAAFVEQDLSPAEGVAPLQQAPLHTPVAALPANPTVARDVLPSVSDGRESDMIRRNAAEVGLATQAVGQVAQALPTTGAMSPVVALNSKPAITAGDTLSQGTFVSAVPDAGHASLDIAPHSAHFVVKTLPVSSSDAANAPRVAISAVPADMQTQQSPTTAHTDATGFPTVATQVTPSSSSGVITGPSALRDTPTLPLAATPLPFRASPSVARPLVRMEAAIPSMKVSLAAVEGRVGNAMPAVSAVPDPAVEAHVAIAASADANQSSRAATLASPQQAPAASSAAVQMSAPAAASLSALTLSSGSAATAASSGRDAPQQADTGTGAIVATSPMPVAAEMSSAAQLPGALGSVGVPSERLAAAQAPAVAAPKVLPPAVGVPIPVAVAPPLTTVAQVDAAQLAAAATAQQFSNSSPPIVASSAVRRVQVAVGATLPAALAAAAQPVSGTPATATSAVTQLGSVGTPVARSSISLPATSSLVAAPAAVPAVPATRAESSESLPTLYYPAQSDQVAPTMLPPPAGVAVSLSPQSAEENLLSRLHLPYEEVVASFNPVPSAPSPPPPLSATAAQSGTGFTATGPSPSAVSAAAQLATTREASASPSAAPSASQSEPSASPSSAASSTSQSPTSSTTMSPPLVAPVSQGAALMAPPSRGAAAAGASAPNGPSVAGSGKDGKSVEASPFEGAVNDSAKAGGPNASAGAMAAAVAANATAAAAQQAAGAAAAAAWAAQKAADSASQAAKNASAAAYSASGNSSNISMYNEGNVVTTRGAVISIILGALISIFFFCALSTVLWLGSKYQQDLEILQHKDVQSCLGNRRSAESSEPPLLEQRASRRSPLRPPLRTLSSSSRDATPMSTQRTGVQRQDSPSTITSAAPRAVSASGDSIGGDGGSTGCSGAFTPNLPSHAICSSTSRAIA
eukprot:TRINITY_DN21851_c1_g1_i1.p1 TRINITY_DN21851_c1_g1~~TRINITY_DN21851_c1_g1_i1.p1  ORF type:complete len:1045 (+),score=180.26 TRINITY_DN21851_c1_g1_i1:211-3345(+)